MKWNGIVSQRGQIAMMTKFATANETHSTSTCLCRRKSITRMSHGFDRRIRAELLAQPADAHVDDVRSRIEVVAPHIGEQPFAAHNFAGMKDEMVEQPELARGQLRRPTVEPRLVTREIQYEATDALHVAAVAVRRPPSYLYTRAREELLEGKRLRQVVARSELEAAQLRPQVDARREDQHRQLRPLLAELPENLEATFFGYSFAFFRQRGEAIVDGPPIKGHAGAQVLWIVLTGVIVIALAAWGSYTLIVSSDGSGGGQGPNPIALPTGYQHALPVQVIGQQWEWTFRYPTYGGIETRDLAIPAHTLVAFHVTSLDVTHSFWAYELGVKADAVSGVDNIAYVNARKTGFFQIRCAELCGLWHGHMAKKGRVLSTSAFQAWIAAAKTKNAAIQKYLPPYNRWYFPAPLRRAG